MKSMKTMKCSFCPSHRWNSSSSTRRTHSITCGEKIMVTCWGARSVGRRATTRQPRRLSFYQNWTLCTKQGLSSTGASRTRGQATFKSSKWRAWDKLVASIIRSRTPQWNLNYLTRETSQYRLNDRSLLMIWLVLMIFHRTSAGSSMSSFRKMSKRDVAFQLYRRVKVQ